MPPLDDTGPTPQELSLAAPAPAPQQSGLDPGTKGRALEVVNGLAQRGMPHDAAVAYAANAVGESRADPHTQPGDAGEARGAFMWEGPRLAAYQVRNGHLPEQGSLDEQLDHVMWENNGPERQNYENVLMTPGGPEEKAKAVSTYWERPKDVGLNEDRRSEIAKQLASSAKAAEPQQPAPLDQLSQSITAARKGGYNDQQIFDAISASPKWGGRIGSALKDGHLPSEVAGFLGLKLAAPAAPEETPTGTAAAPGFHYDAAQRQMVPNGQPDATAKPPLVAPAPSSMPGAESPLGQIATEYGPAPQVAPSTGSSQNLGERAYQAIATPAQPGTYATPEAKAAVEAFGSEPIGMGDKVVGALRKIGIYPPEGGGGTIIQKINEGVLSPTAFAADAIMRSGMAAFAGGQKLVMSALEPLFGEQAARDIAAIPESVAGSPDFAGVPHQGPLTAAEHAAATQERRGPYGAVWEGAAKTPQEAAGRAEFDRRTAEQSEMDRAAAARQPGQLALPNPENPTAPREASRPQPAAVPPVPPKSPDTPAMTQLKRMGGLPTEEPAVAPPPPVAPTSAPEPVAAPPVTPAPAPLPPEPTPTPPPDYRAPANATPFAPEPREPVRLAQFLRQDYAVGRPGDVNTQVNHGGLRDPGGDLAAIAGGNTARGSLRSILGGGNGYRSLINNETGSHLDDAALRAWHAGYFPENDQRPTTNELLNKLDEDINRGNPQYSHHDHEDVVAYATALAHNSEIDRLATEHNLPTRGITRAQFFDQIANHMSQEDAATEHDRMAAEHQDAFDRWTTAARQSNVNPEDYTPRTLEEMENEHRQADAAEAAGAIGPGHAGSEPAGRGPGTGEGGPGQGGRGPVAGGRVGAEGPAGTVADLAATAESTARIARVFKQMSSEDRTRLATLNHDAEQIFAALGDREPDATTYNRLNEIHTERNALLASYDPRLRDKGLDQAAAFRDELPEELAAGRRLPTPPPAGADLFGANREPPTPRTQEPTIRNDQRQQTLAGMEPTAKQAQASRDAAGPKSNQEPANQGLFAPKETEQPELAAPRTSRWLTSAGDNFQDRLAQVRAAGHQSAAEWTLERGQETGHEHLAVVDNHTGEVVHAGTNGEKDRAGFRGDNGATETDRYTIHHNHPNNTALSAADISMLANPGVSHIVAHGHGGTTTYASIGPKFAASRSPTRAQISMNGFALRNAYNRALPLSERLLTPLVKSGEIPVAEANHVYADLANRLLQAHGIINYASTVELPAPVRTAFAALLEKLKLGPDVFDRSAVTVRPEERIAGLPAPLHNGSNERPAGGAPGSAGGEGVSGPAQQELLEGLNAGEERTPGQEAAIRRALRNGPLPPRETPNLVVQGPPRPPREPQPKPPGPEGQLPLREPPQPNTAPSGEPPLPPPDSLWGTPPPTEPPRPPEVEAARITAPAAVKNLNVAEKYTILPRTMASLDDMSARFMNAWEARTREEKTNVAHLVSVIQPNFLQLSKPDRLHVAGALEIARVEGQENLIQNADGTITARNLSNPEANWSHVGQEIRLNSQETAAYHEAVQLGKEQWVMLMRAAAKRYGWGGDINPSAIRAEAESRGEPGDYHRLSRLADLLDVMKQHEQDVYFPMQRFGSHFIAVTPIRGEAVVAAGGGHVPLARFEVIEKPALQDMLGKTKGFSTVDAKAEARIKELRQKYPESDFRITHGDWVSHPSLLRKIDIPAVEKLFMLMENKARAEITNQVMRGDNPPSNKQGIRTEAKDRYDALHGATLEAFYDALFEQLKSGYRRKAKVVPGYDMDFDKSISSHLNQISRNAADTVHRDAIASEYQNIQDYHTHKNVVNYWKKFRDYQENPEGGLSHAANALNQIGFAGMLGMSPSSTMIIALHAPMTAAPVLSVGVGPRVAGPALTRGLARAYAAATFDTVHGFHVDLDKATAGMAPAKQAFLQKMATEGRLASVGTHDMGAMNSHLSGLFGDKADLVRRGMEIATSNVHVVDMANRFGVASAAWDIGSNPTTLNAAAAPLMRNNALFRDMVTREGLSAETYGRFMLSHAAFDWGKESKSPIMRGPIGTAVFSLHGFETRYLSKAWELAKNSGPEGKFAFMLMMAGLGLGAGALGLPGSQDAMKGADEVWKYFTDRDPHLQQKLHDWIANSGLGQTGADMILQGPVSALLGVNLGSRIGFGNVISREMDPANVVGTIPSILWHSASGAYARYQSGQSAAAIAAELPVGGARGALRAIGEYQQGVRTRRGETEIPPEHVSGADLGKTAFGFQPMEQEHMYEERSAYYGTAQPDAWRAMIKSGQTEQAMQEMVKAGWGQKRRSEFLYMARRPPDAPNAQFQRFEQQRGVAPPP